jgi:menaquinone-dependent protoporphyrinogen oxidase
MATDVLVAYATKHGSTREVAEVVAEELHAELRELHELDDLEGCRAVVIGAPLYMGRWHSDARRFLKRHRTVLADVPFAVFALGPLHDSEEETLASRKQLDRALAGCSEIRPASVAVFGGVVDPETLHFPFSHMPAGDARDWDAIREWARGLGGALGQRDGDRAGMPVP